MKRKVSRVLGLMLATTCVLSACVPQKEGDPTDKLSSKTTKTKQVGSEIGSTGSSGDLAVHEGFPIVDEPIEFEIAAQTSRNKDFKELEYFQKLEEKSNVIINWNMSPADGWKEKKSLLFGSTDLPDAFYGQGILTDVDVIKYAVQGVLIPLENLIDKYAPNISKILEEHPEYRNQITAADGHIYSLPTINELNPTTHDKWFINKTWLDKLGMDAPTTWEELKDVLVAFKENDMNGNGDPTDEIPFTFRMTTNDSNDRQQGIQSLFGTFGQLDDINHFVLNNGDVVYTPITEPYKEAISAFHDLYSLGVIDPEAFSHDRNVYVSKIQDPNKVVGMWLGWSRNATATVNKDDYMPLAPLKNTEGKQIWRRVDSKIVSRGAFSITNQAEHPEVLMAWIDKSYEPEVSLEISQGLIGKTLEKTHEGRYRYMKLPEGVILGTMIHDYSPGINGTCGLTQETINKLDLNANLTERKELDEFYSPYNGTTEYTYPNVFFTEDEINKINLLETDINAFVTQKYVGWIVNGGVESEWDSYIKQLEAMKVEDYINIYKQAYERYQKNN